MRIQIPNTEENNIIIFDVEYDGTSLVQLAFLILTKTEPDIFVLSRSVNFYVRQSQPLSPFFKRYTHITNDFLCDEGVDLSVARTLAKENLLGIDYNTSMVVSHGLKGDLEILANNGIDFKTIKHHYCTYDAAKRLLGRNKNLTLKDVAADSGYYMFNEHNAYADVWGTLHAFCYLKEKEHAINRFKQFENSR